jgi:signal transduction histidine kinase
MLAAYVALMSALALAVLGLDAAKPPEAPSTLLWWFLASLGAEYLWVETIQRQGTVSLASAFNFAAIFYLSRSASVWIISASVLLATLIFQRRDVIRAAFGAAQIAVVTFLSSWVFTALAGAHPETTAALFSPRTVAAMIVTFALFFLANTWAVSGAIALSEGQPLVRVWRGNFAYWDEVKESLALFAISPLIILAYQAVGARGFVLFFVPLLVFRNATRRYIQLERAQESVVKAERLAAKGEMAAEIAHELNNSLTVLGGNAHLIEEHLEHGRVPNAAARARSLREQVDEMSKLTMGLMEFAHRNSKLEETDLVGLIERTVEFVRPQNRFDGIDIRLNLDARAGLVAVDAGQIQQVLVNLLCNAADAVRERRNGGGIHVGLKQAGRDRELELTVTDEGVGIPSELLPRIFEPNFTTKAHGHGFGLSTCARIVQNHRGRINVESEVGVGTTVQVLLPKAPKPRTWSGG